MSRNVAKFIFEFFDSEIYFATFRNFRDFSPQTLFDLVAKCRDFSQANGEISRHKKFTSRLFACTSRKVATFRKACRDTKNSRRDFSQGVSRHKKSGCRDDGVFINKLWRLLSPSRLFAIASNFRRDFSPFVSRLFAICVAT